MSDSVPLLTSPSTQSRGQHIFGTNCKTPKYLGLGLPYEHLPCGVLGGCKGEIEKYSFKKLTAAKGP